MVEVLCNLEECRVVVNLVQANRVWVLVEAGVDSREDNLDQAWVQGSQV